MTKDNYSWLDRDVVVRSITDYVFEHDFTKVGEPYTKLREFLEQLLTKQIEIEKLRATIEELEDIKKQYAESYTRIAEELETTREVPHTAFHVIIDQHINQLKAKGEDNGK